MNKDPKPVAGQPVKDGSVADHHIHLKVTGRRSTITDITETVAVLKFARPIVKDTRVTVEQQAKDDAQRMQREEARVIAEARKQISNPELAEVWVNCVQPFRDEIKAMADKAVKTVEEVFAMWHKYAEDCRCGDQSAIMFEFQKQHREQLAPPVFVKVRHRGHLRELVEAGRVEAVDSYHFDDMTGSSRGLDKPMPVAIKPDDYHDRKEGVFYVLRSDFEGNCGRVSQGKTGIVTLYVHSNCNYTFRIKPGETDKNTPSGLPQDERSSSGADGTMVRRNVEHDGVEICFPGKPSREKIDECKAAGFRWSRFSKVWYKKFSSSSWADAHRIAGVEVKEPGQHNEPDRFDMAVEDSMAAQCGLDQPGM